MRAADVVIGPFRERDSVEITGVVEDNRTPPNRIPGSVLVSMAMTLYDEATLAIIGGHNRDPIKGWVDEQGNVTITLTQDDMAILDASLSTEYHRMLLEWVWNVDKRGSTEIQIIVRNLDLVPASMAARR